MSKIIPILIDNISNPIIVGQFENGIVTLANSMEKQKIFDVFGNIAFIAIDYINQGDTMFIKQFRIMSWNINETI